MKRWYESQILFVYDKGCILREEDDPQNAISFFHPSDLPESIRCTLCCQLMGIVQFFMSAFSPPKFVNLQRRKFAIKTAGRFTLGLSGSLDMPESILQRQLSQLNDIFSFYHKSLNTVFEECDCNKDKFEKILDSMCKYYLPVSQHFGSTHALTFNVLPTLELPKSAGSLFLRASHIVEACQAHGSVLAGCILCKKQVLYTQLPPSIMRHLCCISLDQSKIPVCCAKTVFELPEGVTLAFVYLTKEEILKVKDRGLFENSGDNVKNPENRGSLLCNCGKCNESKSVEPKILPSDTSSSEDRYESEMNMHKLVLYMQGHSETQLMLLMEESKWKNPATIIALWKIGLSSLIDLEMDINSCWENAPAKKESDSNYLCLQYDHSWAIMKGDLLPALPEKHEEQLFNRSSQLIHEILKNPSVNDPASPIKELAMVFSDSVIYSHVMGSTETHCQFSLSSDDKSGHTLKRASNVLSNVASKAKRQLERVHGFVLL